MLCTFRVMLQRDVDFHEHVEFNAGSSNTRAKTSVNCESIYLKSSAKSDLLRLIMCASLLSAFSVVDLLAYAEAAPVEKSPAVTKPPAAVDYSLDEKSASSLVAKVDDLVSKNFFNVDQVTKDWKPALSAEREALVNSKTIFEFSSAMNQALAKLKASHTQFVTRNDEAFYFMRSLFGRFARHGKKMEGDFVGLGVGGAHAEKNQVRYVLDASPAMAAGFKRGDKIISIDGQPYTGYDLWYGKTGKEVSVVVKRKDAELKLTVKPEKKDFLDSYVEASEKSAKIMNEGKYKIGYYHFWSGGEGSTDAFSEAVGSSLLQADALILDLRDGYGGASFDDLNLFFRPKSAFPDMKNVSRSGSSTMRQYFDKPLVLLTNKGVRSGKELMAFGIKRSKRGTLIGDTTAGYVLGGRFVPLDANCALYVAAVDVFLDGERLEGKGVEPDIVVSDNLGEKDEVLTAAINNLKDQLDGKK